MFEDLIKDNKKSRVGTMTKDSLIDAMKENISGKEQMILELLDEIHNKNVLIDDLTRENGYLRDL